MVAGGVTDVVEGELVDVVLVDAIAELARQGEKVVVSTLKGTLAMD